MTEQNNPTLLPTPTLKRRLVCMIYEALLVFGVVFFASFIFDVATQSKHALMLRHVREAFLFFIIGAYFIFFWRRSGQTLAMQTWRIKLVDSNGQKVPLIKSVVRYCLAWCWCLPGLILAHQLGLKNAQLLIPVTLGFVAWAFTVRLDGDGQFLHDKLAKTRLVEIPTPNSKSQQA